MKAVMTWLTFLCLPFALVGQQFKRIDNHILVEDNLKSFACAWIDFDNDRDLDLFVGNLAEYDALYRNEGKGVFKKVNQEDVGSIVAIKGDSFSVSWADFNNDGLLDAYVSSFNGPITIHQQIKGNKFQILEPVEGKNESYPAQGGAWADVDLDGDVDLFIANGSGKRNLFLLNESGQSFKKSENEASKPATSSHGVAWGDYNNDRYPDLFVAENYEGPDLFYSNNKGELVVHPNSNRLNDKLVSIGASWVDYDNDGDLDLYVTNSLGKRNNLYRNDGKSGFSKIEDSAIVIDEANSMSACWGDYDNDGDLDLFVANSGTHHDNYYQNNGDGTFLKKDEGVLTNDGKASRGCSCGDFDNDGDLDLYVTSGFGQDDHNMLYENTGGANNWIKLDLIGTKSNRAAIGARVNVTATIGGKKVTQIREVSAQTGAYGHGTLQVHVGLGDAKECNVEILWPSGVQQNIKAAVNTTAQVHEKK